MDSLSSLFQQAISNFNTALLEMGSEAELRTIHIEESQYLENSESEDKDKESASTNETELSFLDMLSEGVYNECLDSKILNIKMNSVSLRRKDELFKRHKREQEERYSQRRKELELQYAFNTNDVRLSGEFSLCDGVKNEMFSLKAEDFEKLKPETDLNDTIMDNYLKFMSISILPQQTRDQTFIFSTFFMAKLLGEQLRADLIPERESDSTKEKVRLKVIESYPIMKRWTKRVDLFSLSYLVIPINAYKHWNSIIVVNPKALCSDPDECKIVYLDSMFEKKIIFPEAIKAFLELELRERKQTDVSLENIQTYQMLVPRQTNTHDCGLYTLCYVEKLLKNHEILDQTMETIDNRCQLSLLPRSLIFTMRELLRQLFKGLLVNENKNEVIQNYLLNRQKVEEESIENDFDKIDEKEFAKYFQLNSHMLLDKTKSESEIEYQCMLKFYLDCDINHYERDQPL